MIFIAGISLAVFIEILLLSKRDKSDADRILALWMFFISLHLFLFYFWLTDAIYDYPFLLGIEKALPLCQSVFLYLYVAAVTDQWPGNKKITLLHFLPALLTYIYLLPFFLLSAEQKIYVYKNNGAGHESFEAVMTIAIAISGIVYIGWSIFLLKKHADRILDQFSYQTKIDLQWLRVLIWGLAGIWILIFVSDETVLFGGVAVFVFLIGFFGIRQARIFAETAPEPTEKGKYAKSGLTEAKATTLYETLIRLMQHEALHRKSDLSVDDLAVRLEVHPNYLSQVINTKAGMNFYDFVNRYRLEEFKKLASDPKNRQFTMLALAFDCGFNSKSSFNRYFKKATGQTPSQYFTALSKQ